MRKCKLVFKCAVAAAGILTVLSQLLLLHADVRLKLSHVEQLEAQYVYSEQEQARGAVTLELIGISPDAAIRILENGECVALFSEPTVQLPISDNAVIEIDARNIPQPFSVQIADLAGNLSGYYEQKIDLNANIQILGRFFIK